jgi:hypothetical protein
MIPFFRIRLLFWSMEPAPTDPQHVEMKRRELWEVSTCAQLF